MNKLTLPANSKMMSKAFTFGVATAAFQIEGGIDQRLPCIWDTFCAQKGNIADGSDGSVACDHFNLWRNDIDLIESLGVDAYRLSISWPRVIKVDGSLNNEGVNFYLNILDELQRLDIKAYVTLYHWDLPQHLEEQGGWLNRETAYKFADYVDKITKAFGDRVFSYATLNEPFCSAFLGYELGIHAPGKVGREFGKKAAHHLLLAHGLGMQVLKKNSPSTQNGIVINFTPGYSCSENEEDIAAAKFADDYFNQWYAKPLLDGRYPEIISSLPVAHQPDIRPGDMDIISEPLDFLGINFYTRALYQTNPAYKQDQSLLPFIELPAPTPHTDMGWEIYPLAFSELLISLNRRYNLPPVFITENGAAMPDKVEDGAVNDLDRLSYYQQHLLAVNEAIESGVNIQGYFAWSLMDNFEWAEGYKKRFGIVRVEYRNLSRTIKTSGLAYRDLITSRQNMSR